MAVPDLSPAHVDETEPFEVEVTRGKANSVTVAAIPLALDSHEYKFECRDGDGNLIWTWVGEGQTGTERIKPTETDTDVWTIDLRILASDWPSPEIRLQKLTGDLDAWPTGETDKTFTLLKYILDVKEQIGT